MNAARTVLEHTNILDAKVDDFVGEAGLARGTFYIYFSDKLDLLRALTQETIEQVFEDALVKLDRNVHPLERLKLSLAAILRSWQAHAGVLSSLYQLSLVREDFDYFAEDLRRPFVERMQLELESSMKRGRAHPINSQLAADAFGTLVGWTCMRWFGQGHAPSEQATIDDVVETLALLWYRALFAADPDD